MRKIAAAALLSLAAVAAPGLARKVEPVAQPAATAGYDIAKTEIGTLLDDPAARAVLDRHVPGFSKNPQFDMARTMTLKAMQKFAPEKLSEATLASIQADIAKLPPRK
jgi:para-nitrobenzyl esterase